MSTGIEWTDETWNPVTGCTKVSPGCDNCYAEKITERFHGRGSFETIVLHPERLDMPVHWRRPRRVFVNSMSDLFHDDVPDDFIGAVFGAMALAGQHIFQVLTKRPGRMASLLPRLPAEIRRGLLAHAQHADADTLLDWSAEMAWPLPNVWLGTSIENQKWADVRIPKLLQTPAAVRFLSVEPLLGPVLLAGQHYDIGSGTEVRDAGYLRDIDWVIVGGESGPGARPMHPDWARSLRDECAAVGVPFFFKQHGEWRHYLQPDTDGFPEPGVWLARDGRTADHTEALEGGDWTGMYRLGKHRAGRLLDGRTWDEMPAAVQAVST